MSMRTAIISGCGGGSRRARRRARRCALVAWMVLFPGAIAVAEPLSEGRRRELLSEGAELFDRASELWRSRPEDAARLYRDAAARFASLSAGGLRNAGVEYNAGNAYYRAGDLGRAVLHFRRGLAIEPRDGKLLANLTFVRGQVAPALAPSGAATAWRAVAAWHQDIPLATRAWLAMGASLGGWAVLISLRLSRRRAAPLAGIAVAGLVVGVAAGGSALWELRDRASRPHAVVVVGGTTLRLGRGESYEPALRDALGAGVELRILQERGGWVEVQLRDDQTGWLPAETVERV